MTVTLLPKFRRVKGGPRTVETAALAEAAEQRRLLANHPADCAVCAGASHPATMLELHRRHLAAISEQWREQEAARKAAAARYYDGGYRMVIGGVPTRVAAYVKDWAPWMKKALGRGTVAAYGADSVEVARQAKILGLTKERLPTTFYDKPTQPEQAAA